jgi:ABC-type phosphate transport system substrate-binding protein
MLWTRALVSLAAGASLAAIAGTAHATPNCSSLPGPVYVTGSSAVQNFLAGIATALANNGNTVTIVYSPPGSCQGVDAIFNGTKMMGTATFWDTTGTATTCQLDPAGNTVDVGVSDVYFTSCAGYNFPATLPAGVGEFFGPNQVMNFVVPVGSSQTLISAAAAYFVYGFGQNGMVMPWNNNSFIFQRGAASGTQSMIAAAIQVPPNKWVATTTTGGSAGMLAAVANSTSADATIGILASDVADKNRTTVKALAFQAFDQDCAWLPDSSSTAFDKKNVRDGHYDIWGPIHFYAKVDGGGNPTNPAAANLIGYFTDKVATPPGVNLLDLEIAGHTVPSCAMKVKRSSEVGPMSPYTPPAPCGCYFDFKATGSTTCASCAQDSDCTSAGATHCRHGYCEAN